MFKKIIVTVLFLNFIGTAYGQTNDSLFFYAKKLNWESLGVIPSYANTNYRFDVNASKIIEIISNNKQESIQLLQLISHPEKTVAIHAILTKIYFPKLLLIGTKSIFKIGTDGLPIYNEVTANEFSLNNLCWKLKFDNSLNYSIDSLEISKIKIYWSKTLSVINQKKNNDKRSLGKRSPYHTGKVKSHINMIKFLINYKQLENVGDTSNIAFYEGRMFDRVVATFGSKANKATLYVFGSNSAHGKHYIAIKDVKGLALLPTKDMPIEIQPVLDFFKRNRATSKMMLKVLPVIADTYQHNTISYIPKVEN